MATFTVTGLGPVRPVEAMTTAPEGGAAAALRVAGSLLGGRPVELVGSGTLLRPAGAESGDLLLATYGETVVLLGGTDGVRVPEGTGSWTVTLQSVTDAVAVEVDAEPIYRFVALSPDAVEVDEGEPLPCETPYWAGAHDVYPGEHPAFDTDEWAGAVLLWTFGWDPVGGAPGPVDPAGVPLHTVRPG